MNKMTRLEQIEQLKNEIENLKNKKFRISSDIKIKKNCNISAVFQNWLTLTGPAKVEASKKETEIFKDLLLSNRIQELEEIKKSYTEKQNLLNDLIIEANK